MHARTRAAALTPLALKDAPALIETVFPAQKVSFEAQSERKAVAAQTLTGLGSYWKGRKPLILVRAIVLGSLLPPTDDAEADLAIFEKLMAFDDEGLARRALAANAWSATAMQELISVSDPERYFSGRAWRRDITEDEKLELYRRALARLPAYEEKASLGKRPEEVDEYWLYAPTWPDVNRHYAHLGLSAQSLPELIEQLGVLRYGHRPRVGDTFSGGGSIPFEAARMGCDAYASDLNPVACMLTWGALHIAGAKPSYEEEVRAIQAELENAVDHEIASLGIEHDELGNRSKAYLYCLETRCPESGWMVPICPSWVISKKRGVIARLVPDAENQRFVISVETGVSASDLAAAEVGTLQGRNLTYKIGSRQYSVPIKTIRGEYRDGKGETRNRLRLWERDDVRPRPGDTFQERLFAVQWFDKPTTNPGRRETFFASVTDGDFDRENRIGELLERKLAEWQEIGLVPDMPIETGKENEGPIRTNGWTYWHHMFMPRQLLVLGLLRKQVTASNQHLLPLIISKYADNNSKSCRWATSQAGGDGGAKSTFDNQALKTIFNWANRSFLSTPWRIELPRLGAIRTSRVVDNCSAPDVRERCDMFITDPPYADAVHYHEITEFFIAWLRKNPPQKFADWVWDSRRALAIKGSGDDFRRGMVSAYRAMAEHMPDNGIQCVMFTHQDTGVWGDLIGIFWAAGLQVVAAWYIATETTSELKKGGYVQGTVILMLRKRAAGERTGFKQRLLPAVRQEVARQIETMMHLNDSVRAHHGEPAFNDSDLQMAGYAAALKVLTAYTHIGGEDVTTFAIRPRPQGEITVVDEIVQQAAETASSLLVPEGLTADSWAKLMGIERFVLRMLDMETTGSTKLDNYQNFAKAFHVEDYARVMGDMRPNYARLKRVSEFASRELSDATEIGGTRLGRLIIALQQMQKDTEPQVIVDQMRGEMADFLELRPLLVDVLAFMERKSAEPETRGAAEVLGARLKNLRFGE
jgi:putative DNA methylase